MSFLNKTIKKLKNRSRDVLYTLLEPSESTNPNSKIIDIIFKKTELTSKVEEILKKDDDYHHNHPIFCELIELRHCKKSETQVEWVETARWIKFEEDVDEEGQRWSKPHVATISLRSIIEVRKSINCGTVILDLEVDSFEKLVDALINEMIQKKTLSITMAANVASLLLSKHRHQYEHEGASSQINLPFVRSIVDMRKHSKNEKKNNRIQRNKFSLADMTNGESHGSNSKKNEHFLKKIPEDAEAANILVGMVNFLDTPLHAFVRLAKGTQMGDLTEVSVPTRFFYLLLGPDDRRRCYHETGRAISTLLSDDVFHDIAYKATNTNDIMVGIDEFLDQCTVLPPGEWDPNIRIEPPSKIPDQEGRKHYSSNLLGDGSSGSDVEIEDNTLKYTHRIFGGLRDDFKRKIPFYKSDFKDAIHVQTISTIFFMYFACLTPAITFGGLLKEDTHYIGIIECLLGVSVCGVLYHLFSGQPLTIINNTGPVLVFETIIYKFCSEYGLNFLSMRFWIGFWIMLILIVIVAFDLSSLVRYITRFTEEIFSLLIAVIFCVEAFSKLIHLRHYHPNVTNLNFLCFCYAPINETICNFEATKKYTVQNVTSVLSSNITSILPTNASQFTVLNYNGTSENFFSFCSAMHGVLLDRINFHNVDTEYPDSNFFFSIILFIGTFTMAMYLKQFNSTRYFTHMVRSTISNFAVPISILCMVLLDYFCNYHTAKLVVPSTIVPTVDRPWVVNPFDNPYWVIPAAIIPALLASILIFMDQQITCVIVNRKENMLKKGAGYHLDLLIIAIEIGLMSVFGFPWFVAATVLSISHVHSLNVESKSAAPGEKPKFLGIREQRVTGIVAFALVGLSVLFTRVLDFVPMAVLFGVFLFMGISSTMGLQILQRFLIIFMSPKYQPDYMWLRHVPLKRVNLFTILQILCFILLWVIKKTKPISIAFPLMIVAICFIRKLFDFIFSQHELTWLDDKLPEFHKKKKDDYKKGKSRDPNANITISTNDGKMVNISPEKMTFDPTNNVINLGTTNDTLRIEETPFTQRGYRLRQRHNSEAISQRKLDYSVSMTPNLRKKSLEKQCLLKNKYRNVETRKSFDGVCFSKESLPKIYTKSPSDTSKENYDNHVSFSILPDKHNIKK